MDDRLAAMLGGIVILASFLLAGIGIYSLFQGLHITWEAVIISLGWTMICMSCLVLSIHAIKQYSVQIQVNKNANGSIGGDTSRRKARVS